ncbi:RagB/SusD family nutrient uptake outer membrane protein [Proteiniphilum sp. X52]|uniref:RagB/SusD family nutrient uptake outer membrane protein n=1 Tax=Proteiniphilum sp. X52 TaxID=2382159 RepID=UPI000F09FFBD|nr:RagB/SusD family nutrient uptake outer membrane protein [Proteiniphilum sp. X52]RNC63363.1 RagB/SusD family nutrient uptake outer membrane protein [Proteiniphilum sp. X52]
MNRLKLLSILLAVISFPTFFSSCKDFLNIDRYFDDEFKVDSIFTQTRYVEAYMWGAAAMFADEGQIFSTSGQDVLGPLATDEAFTMFNVDGSSSYSGMRFVLGHITPDNLGPFGNNYKNLYKIVRKCNTILSRIDEVPEMSASDRMNILGYTRFIRAYAYNKLLMEFGPPVILGDDVIETNEPIEYYDRPRSTYDEAVAYICDEFEKAAEYMPVTVPILDFGRPTKGAAYSLVARLRLQHASPLYNGGQAARIYFGDWKRLTDGAFYVSQTYDESRWALAAAAARRVIDMDLAGGPLYRLYTVVEDEQTPVLPENVSDPSYREKFPAGAGGIDHYKSYSEMFNGECVPSVNPEFIWARKSDGLKSYTRASFPIVHGGWGGMAVPQKVIDSYYMQDGRTIDNASDAFPYSEEGFTSGIRSFSGYRLNAGVYNMYVNREMRFYASIGFSEGYWPCTSASSAGDYNLTVTYYYDSPNGKSNPNALVNHTPTGYVMKKYIHPMDAWSGTNARVVDKVFPIIRFAEILLSYAEALNNLTTTHTVELNGETYTFSRDVNEIANAFNPVRYRAGLPGLSDVELQSQRKIQELLEKERMIEFLFENRRFYDVRRWGIYENVENDRITGMNVDANKEGYYQRVIPNTARIGSRIINKRMVFLPLPRAEIRRLPSLDQNPGW